MGPTELSALKGYFTSIEPKLPQVVAAMYARMFDAAPEAKPLFKGDLQEHQKRYTRMLQTIVKLTRSSHLWPVGAFTGQASLPVLDKLGTIHADAGITRAHFDLMKAVLAECCKEIQPEGFTPRVEKALGFIFDVIAGTLTKSRDVHIEEMERKNKLPTYNQERTVEELYGFFGAGDILNLELSQAIH